MAWTRQEINVQWFGDHVSGLPDDAPEAFDVAERIRGLEWVLGQEFEFGGMKLPGVGVRAATMNFSESTGLVSGCSRSSGRRGELSCQQIAGRRCCCGC
jgi:hypothetical protein